VAVLVGTRTRLRSSAAARRPQVRLAAAESRTATIEAESEEDSNIVAPEKVAYIRSLFDDILEVRVPKKLEVFLAVLQGSGYTILGKDDWKQIGGDLHPFLLALATREGESADDLEVIGLLVRQPNGSSLYPDEYQVVTQRPRKSKVVSLVAFDMEKYIMKRAEEATFRKETTDKPIIEATKDVYQVRFEGGDQTALDKWLLLEVGAFPDTYVNLSQEHIRNNDVKTGLVIADTMRDAFGAAWGFPHAYCCRVLRHEHFESGEDKRGLEASHCAQRCFTSGYPLWTLSEEDADELNDLLCEAEMPSLGSVDALRVFYLKRATDDQRAAVRTGSISLGCATLSKAQALMDSVVCGYKSYQGIRAELRDLYDEVPGCESLMQLIEYYMP